MDPAYRPHTSHQPRGDIKTVEDAVRQRFGPELPDEVRALVENARKLRLDLYEASLSSTTGLELPRGLMNGRCYFEHEDVDADNETIFVRVQDAKERCERIEAALVEIATGAVPREECHLVAAFRLLKDGDLYASLITSFVEARDVPSVLSYMFGRERLGEVIAKCSAKGMAEMGEKLSPESCARLVNALTDGSAPLLTGQALWNIVYLLEGNALHRANDFVMTGGQSHNVVLESTGRLAEHIAGYATRYNESNDAAVFTGLHELGRRIGSNRLTSQNFSGVTARGSEKFVEIFGSPTLRTNALRHITHLRDEDRGARKLAESGFAAAFQSQARRPDTGFRDRLVEALPRFLVPLRAPFAEPEIHTLASTASLLLSAVNKSSGPLPAGWDPVLSNAFLAAARAVAVTLEPEPPLLSDRHSYAGRALVTTARSLGFLTGRIAVDGPRECAANADEVLKCIVGLRNTIIPLWSGADLAPVLRARAVAAKQEHGSSVMPARIRLTSLVDGILDLLTPEELVHLADETYERRGLGGYGRIKSPGIAMEDFRLKVAKALCPLATIIDPAHPSAELLEDVKKRMRYDRSTEIRDLAKTLPRRN